MAVVRFLQEKSQSSLLWSSLVCAGGFELVAARHRQKGNVNGRKTRLACVSYYRAGPSTYQPPPSISQATSALAHPNQMASYQPPPAQCHPETPSMEIYWHLWRTACRPWRPLLHMEWAIKVARREPLRVGKDSVSPSDNI